MPEPCGLVVKNGTNRLAVFEMPGPSSSTETTTCPARTSHCTETRPEVNDMLCGTGGIHPACFIENMYVSLNDYQVLAPDTGSVGLLGRYTTTIPLTGLTYQRSATDTTLRSGRSIWVPNGSQRASHVVCSATATTNTIQIRQVGWSCI